MCSVWTSLKFRFLVKVAMYLSSSFLVKEEIILYKVHSNTGKRYQETVNKCHCCSIIEVLLKKALNTKQSVFSKLGGMSLSNIVIIEENSGYQHFLLFPS